VGSEWYQELGALANEVEWGDADLFPEFGMPPL
jgi:hypothetical protein